MLYYGPLLNRRKERLYTPPAGLEEDVNSYLSKRVYNGFSKPFTLRRFVCDTVQSVMRELLGADAPDRPNSIWVDLGLDEEIATDDDAFKRGLKEIGEKYRIGLNIHPANFER